MCPFPVDPNERPWCCVHLCLLICCPVPSCQCRTAPCLWEGKGQNQLMGHTIWGLPWVYLMDHACFWLLGAAGMCSPGRAERPSQAVPGAAPRSSLSLNSLWEVAGGSSVPLMELHWQFHHFLWFVNDFWDSPRSCQGLCWEPQPCSPCPLQQHLHRQKCVSNSCFFPDSVFSPSRNLHFL